MQACFDDISRHSVYYEDFLSLIEKVGGSISVEKFLEVSQSIAAFAETQHTGRFADGRLENPILEIGSELRGGTELPGNIDGLNISARAKERRSIRRRILHVATSLYPIGGHTKTVLNWIAADPTSDHVIFLTDQRGEVGQRNAQFLRELHCETVILPPESPRLVKAEWLRGSASACDLVILHHSGRDAVPTVAFGSSGGPPVCILNHADHIFWLGSTVADAVINLRPIGKELTISRRHVDVNLLMPIPLQDYGFTLGRKEARVRLGIPASQVVLLSIGRAEKYKPIREINFIKTVVQILDRCRNASIYILGLSREEACCLGIFADHERIHFLGSLDDPRLYQLAADVYLEGFPCGSQTALLETGMCGVPPVLAYSPLLDLLTTSDESIAPYVSNPGSEAEYIERACTLIERPRERVELGSNLRDRILADHTGEGWLARVNGVYRETNAMAHKPRAIPRTTCLMSDQDLALCEWQAPSSPIMDGPSDPHKSLRGFVLNLAYETKQNNRHLCAMRIVLAAMGIVGLDRRLLWFMVKLLPQLLLSRMFNGVPE